MSSNRNLAGPLVFSFFRQLCFSFFFLLFLPLSLVHLLHQSTQPSGLVSRTTREAPVRFDSMPFFYFFLASNVFFFFSRSDDTFFFLRFFASTMTMTMALIKERKKCSSRERLAVVVSVTASLCFFRFHSPSPRTVKLRLFVLFFLQGFVSPPANQKFINKMPTSYIIFHQQQHESWCPHTKSPSWSFSRFPIGGGAPATRRGSRWLNL